MNPFKLVAQEYVDRGISVIPAVYGQKGCTMPQWNMYCRKLPSYEEVQRWSTSQHNIGILLGELSGIVAFDFDYDVNDLQNKILQIIPDSPVKKKGAKGFTAFYRYNGEKSRSFHAEGQTVLDILSDGKLTIMPPSKHPSGCEYTWVDPNYTLLNVPKSALPIITDAMMDKIKDLFIVKKAPSFNTRVYKLEDTDEISDIKEALEYISPDCDYTTWLNVGMAINDYFNGDLRGYEIYNSWSAKGDKYKGWAEVKSKYESFKNNGITINTLFSYAMDGGFVRRTKESEIGSYEILSEEENKELDKFLSQTFNKKETIEELENKILQAPGLVGQITDYINKVSLLQTPILSLAAAIPATGTIYGQKIRSETDLRTNIYTLAVSESGSGKDAGRKAVLALFDKCSQELKKHFIGKPASDSGLMSALEESNGVALMQIDEFGHFLHGINNKKDAPKYLAGIMSLLTELYSTASSTLIGQQYSNRQSDKKRVDIEQPCVSVLGSTVPDRLYNALSQDEILDGFLTRWIFFENRDYDPALNPERIDLQSYMPTKLMENIKNIRKSFTPIVGEGLNQIVKIKTKIVPLTPEAKTIANEYYMEIKSRRAKAIENNDLMKVVYTRSYENMIKLALVGSEITPNGLAITKKSIEWAINVIKYSNTIFERVIGEHIASSQYEENLNGMYNYLKNRKKPISKEEFNRAFKKFPVRERTQMLDDLRQQGRVNIVKDEDKKEFISARR